MSAASAPGCPLQGAGSERDSGRHYPLWTSGRIVFLNRHEIFIGDRKVSNGEGMQAVFYSVSDRYFVQAFGARFHEALMQGLGTVTPPC
jgi:hypothetical protein